jgi:uncharacterized protein
MIVEQINEGSKGYFKASENGKEAGNMYYTWSGSGKFIIDHTEVSPDFAGKGVGKKLVMEAVRIAREKNIKIVPFCPFAKSVFDGTPEIQDVLD